LPHLFALFVLFSFLAGRPVHAFEWGVFADSSPSMRDCLRQSLSERDLKVLAKSGAERPKDKALRKKSKNAYKTCQRAALDEAPKILPVAAGNCGSLPPPYDGPLFDAMTQIDERMDMANAILSVQAAGVDRMALFARSRKALGENEDEVLALRERWPGFIVLGAPKYFLLRGDLDDAFVEATVGGVRDKNYAFVGEVLYTHGDKSHGETTADGERYVDPRGPGTAKLLRTLAAMGRPVPVMTHWEVYAWDRDWPRFSTLYGNYPEQMFVVPHMAFGSAEQMRMLLGGHRNVIVSTSKKDKDKGGYSDTAKAALLGDGFIDGCGRLKSKWRDLLVTFKDRILFATDAHKNHRWKIYAKLIRTGRAWLGQLPAEVAQAIAFDNAERIYLPRN